jgi:hypothetical protein
MVVACAAGIGMGALCFLVVLWNLGVRPLRSAGRGAPFARLFDIQARALLRGDIAVPNGSLGIEAFREGDREYLYFGPLPALLRMPVLALTDSLDGRLTALSILAAWIVTAVVISLLVWRVRTMTLPDRLVTQLEQIAVAGLIASITGGSALLHLAALPWVYSEALMWSVAMSIGAVYASIGMLQRPSVRRLVIAAAAVLGAVLTRSTAGWGTGLTLAAVGVAFAVGRRFHDERRWALPTLCAASIPLAFGIAINWAKFRHAVLIPFEDQVWTDVSWRRQRVLREGWVADIRFLPSTIYNYLRPWGIRLSSVFPFIATPAEPAQAVGGVFIEMPYPTPSATSTMPALFVLSGFGVFHAFRRRTGDGFALMRIPLVGALSVVGGILMVGYITPRYLAEFVPFLTLASVVGMCGLLRQPGRRGPLAITGLLTIAALATFGAMANLAIASTTARVGGGGPPLLDFVAAQRWISERTGQPMNSLVEVGDDLPKSSEPGQIRILGACDAMYYGTGDLFEPWILFDFRDLHLRIEFDDTGRRGQDTGSLPVVRFEGATVRAIVMEFDTAGNYRLVLTGGESTESSPWRAPGTGAVDLWIVAQLDRGTYLIASPGHLYTTVLSNELQPDLRNDAKKVIAIDAADVASSGRGFTVLTTPEPASGLCRELIEPT